jgi:PAS domain S-box-containing protein
MPEQPLSLVGVFPRESMMSLSLRALATSLFCDAVVRRNLFPQRTVATWCLALLGACLLVLPVSGAVYGEYSVTTWETEDGLPENSATSMVQTPDGYLWFGTFNGLVRFDGAKFTVFDRLNTPDLPSSGIINLHLDREGAMWISTLQGTVVRRSDGWQVISRHPEWKGNFVRTFAERRDGQLAMSTFDGEILVWSNNRLRRIPSPRPEKREGFHVAYDSTGLLWAMQLPAYVGTWDGTNWTTVPLKDPAVSALASSRDGGVWVAGTNNLFKFTPGKPVKAVPLARPIHNVWSLHEDSEGTVWIASYLHGLRALKPDGTASYFSQGYGLSYNATRFAFEDREKNIWVGTSGGGLSQFKKRRFEVLGTEDGLPERLVRAIVEEKPGVHIIGTYGGGVVRMDNGVVTPVRYKAPGSGQGVFVQALCIDREGDLWIGTYKDGVVRVRNGVSYPLPSSETGERINSIFQDSDGTMWIGSEGGLVFRTNDTWTRVTVPGLQSVRMMAEDRASQTLWVTTGNGLFRKRGGTWTHFNERDGLPANRIGPAFVDRAGTLWVGTTEAGLVRYRNGRFVSIGEAHGFPARLVSSIQQSDDGMFWVGSNRGVIQVDPNELNAVADGRRATCNPRVFDSSDGLVSIECSSGNQNTSLRDSQGRIWFGTLKGAAVIDPKELVLNTQPPPVIIERLTIEDERGKVTTISGQSEPVVPAGTRRLQIHYTGLCYAAPGKLKFQYRLQGLDKEWVNAGKERVAYLHDLPPGRYVFQVRASNNDGFWNMSGAALAFRVEPFYWQTWTFRVGVVVLFAASVAGGVWMMLRQRMRREIAELRREHLLTETRARLASVVENTSDLVAFFDDTGRITYLNTAGRQLLGVGPNAPLGQVTLSAWHREWMSGKETDLVAAARAKGFWAGESNIARPDGTSIPVSQVLVAHCTQTGALEFASTIIRDISSSKRAEAALRESEMRFRLLIENSADLVAELDSERRLLYASPTFFDALGLHPTELLGTDVCEWINAEDREFFLKTLEQPHGHIKFRCRHKNGDWRWFDGGSRQFTTSSGEKRRVLVWRDITERHLAEEERARLEAQLRQSQKLEALGTLAGGIAHDFNNILSVIIGYGHLAQLDTPEQGPVAEHLAQILAASERARDLVKQILAFSRKQKQERKPVQLDGVVTETLKLMRSTLPATIEIQSRIEPAGLVMADPTQIHQVMMNLCANAAHAMRHRPGTLRVVLESVCVDAAMVRDNSDLRPGAYVRLSVQDTGHGMDVATLKRVFDPFFTTKAQGEGTGLGLAVVHGIIRGHDGAINVRSQPNQGTTFDLYFPLLGQEDLAAELPAAEAPERVAGSGQRVLIVDDEPEVRSVLEKTLVRGGYRVTVADGPARALEVFRKEPAAYDLIVTDLTMPGMTGMDFASEVMKLRADVPMILMTGYSGSLTRENAIEFGFRELLLKPVLPADLRAAIQRVFDSDAKASRE